MREPTLTLLKGNGIICAFTVKNNSAGKLREQSGPPVDFAF
jgi:hypothetical protein